jgi:DNA mismatch endonuclease (patch repair protein)
MTRIKGKNTKPEIMLRKALWREGVRYRLAYKLDGKPDLVIPKTRIVIFIDGCFWHQCPLHCKIPDTNRDFWVNKLSRNVQRDKVVTEILEKAGWRVFRCWEHEVRQGLADVINKILGFHNSEYRHEI